MLAVSVLLGLARFTASLSVVIDDPSSYVNVSKDAVDNSLLSNYSGTPTYSLLSPLQAAYSFNGSGNITSLNHKFYTVDANDTDVILVSDGAKLNLSFIEVLKEGYSTSIFQSSFFGVNAAINVQNASTAFFDHINVTVHNGAANIYSYGNNTVIHVDNAYLYSSGPVSHGLYAAGYGTIVANNIQHYSGGIVHPHFLETRLLVISTLLTPWLIRRESEALFSMRLDLSSLITSLGSPRKRLLFLWTVYKASTFITSI